MNKQDFKAMLRQHAVDYGMIGVLLLLCVYYSFATVRDQQPQGAEAAAQILDDLAARDPGPRRVILVAGADAHGLAFTQTLRAALERSGVEVALAFNGSPPAARQAFEKLPPGAPVDAIVCTAPAALWSLLSAERRRSDFPALADAALIAPRASRWPAFLKTRNLLNVANQIAVIAIIAIGMTMVILTAGIDLSVGSLIALSAVTATLLIRDAAGAVEASAFGVFWCCAAAVIAAGLFGLFQGITVTVCRIPAFIATLAGLLIARGLAFRLTGGETVTGMPDGFEALGRGSTMGIPNAVILMLVLYAVAHLVMTRTTLGRYIYAVGGNPEASRLSGVPVRRVLLVVYTVSGAMAGVAGVIMASTFQSGDPKFGKEYELQVIAAVVVGGTSLFGGEGKILATLIGALLIGVIKNGMNLTEVDPFDQDIVLGAVILGAVFIDQFKKHGWSLFRAGSGA